MPRLSRAQETGRQAVQICLLGGFSVAINGAPIREDAWRLQRARTLVKLLALAQGHRLHREQAIDALWGERLPSDPGNSLHQVVRAARQALTTATPDAKVLIAFDGDQIHLSAPSTTAGAFHLTDVEAFEAAAAQARRHSSMAAYRAAIALYTGDLLPQDRYADWAAVRRATLASQFVDLLLGLARTHEAEIAPAEAIEVLRRVVLIDPAHEEARVHLMRLHALCGMPGEAEREYQALIAALEEIGARPGRMSQQMRADIQSGRFPAVHPDAPSPLPGEASTTLETGAPTTNLPFDTSRFIGRTRESAELVLLLTDSRLVTITGVGGGGKTRLALHVAQSLVPNYRDGVWLVEFAALAQPSLVAQAMAAALRVPERADISATESLVSALDRKHLLLVLDNCEHLIEACAQLVETLLRRCRDLCILCTSREPLHIAGEVVWRIAALSLPDPRRLPAVLDQSDLDLLTHYESVELFRARARSVTPSFTLTAENARSIAHICHRLDGLPLAIELAAALVGSLSLEQIATQLDRSIDILVRGSRTALTRQQTLRGALDWSYDLLPEHEQQAFRRLAVFAGRFDLAAAHAIMSPGETQPVSLTVLVLNELTDKSLVVTDTAGEESQYHLLEPIRQYAEQRLVEAHEALDTHMRHARWYAALSVRADAMLWTAEHESALASLEANRANVRAALGWWLRDPEGAENGLRHAQSLWQYWIFRGALAEGRGWLDRLTALAPRISGERANALLCAVGLDFRLATYNSESTHALVREAIEINRMVGDAAGTGRALRFQGMLAYLESDVRRAKASFQESLDLAREAGEPSGECLALHSLGMTALLYGNLREAHSYLERSLDVVRSEEGRVWRVIAPMNPAGMPLTVSASRIDFVSASRIDFVSEETWVLLRSVNRAVVEGYILAHLGSLARCRGDFAAARSLQEDARRLFEREDDREGMAQVSGQLGNLARVEGDFAAAYTHLRESLRLRRTLGDRRGIIIAINNLGMLAADEGNYARANALYARSYADSLRYGDVSALQFVLMLQARLAFIRNDFRLAEELNLQLLDMMRASSSPFFEVTIHGWLAEAALKQGDREAARASYTACLADLERLGDEGAASMIRAMLTEIGTRGGDSGGIALPADGGA
ncbi:MAG TPA: tetratricopeptide repeat protein [Ktedonobacterales bacterium]|nr:tetratricopeptide repeat protein [Ktedonobacterales bacterium]